MMVTLQITMDVPQCVQHKVVTLPATVQGMRYRELVENVLVFVGTIYWSKHNNVRMATCWIMMDAHLNVKPKGVTKHATVQGIIYQE